MAKLQRTVVGSIYRAKDKTKSDYIHFRGDTKIKNTFLEALNKMDEKKGLSLILESKTAQLTSLDSALAEGKLSEDIAGKIRERINKIPDYVRFEIILLS